MLCVGRTRGGGGVPRDRRVVECEGRVFYSRREGSGSRTSGKGVRGRGTSGGGTCGRIFLGRYHLDRRGTVRPRTLTFPFPGSGPTIRPGWRKEGREDGVQESERDREPGDVPWVTLCPPGIQPVKDQNFVYCKVKNTLIQSTVTIITFTMLTENQCFKEGYHGVREECG